MGSLAIGSVLLILILYKYMKTRRLLTGPGRRGWWASGGSKERSRDEFIGTERTIESGVTSVTKRTSYDRALVTRFTIGFVILAYVSSAMEVDKANLSTVSSKLQSLCTLHISRKAIKS
jgi:hypothetical protein